MRVLGSTDPRPEAAAVFDVHLDHGVDPTVLAHDQGYAVLRPLVAVRAGDGDLLLRLLVRPLEGEPRPRQPQRGHDPALVVTADEQPQVRQRFAAYAVVTSTRGLLATEYSERTAVPGRWGMPGGGIDRGEQPADAVRREITEETGQQVELGDLVAVQTSHWVGRSPRGTLEDFQAVRLVYRARCPEPGEPVVLDADGTTASALWVSTDSWRALPWTHDWERLLGELLDEPA